ncbi:aminoglycoside phosphotransferase family protein [Nonomuraea sp. NPDC047529]|uniref:aminoglycoside phosphotransferase family protein n=1 Tax=Nonomuraea sp. NPDC047529 TaxID=3155623 RepID=UPI0033EC2914
MIEIPEAFARATVEREGEPGAAWLAELPGIAGELLDRWGCVPDGEVLHGGVGIVVPVRRRAGEAAVLKVSFPHPGNVHEPDAFAAWGGRGAAPPRHAVDAAVATVRELGRVQPDLLVHGDLHARNVLRADREPWLAVDPKGYAGDPAYDGGTLLKSRALTLLEADDLGKAVHRVLDVFAEAAEVDRERARRWAQFHAVQAAFWGRRHGFRIARGGARLDRLTEFADHLAELLTEGR